MRLRIATALAVIVCLPALARGANVWRGRIVHPAVAQLLPKGTVKLS